MFQGTEDNDVLTLRWVGKQELHTEDIGPFARSLSGCIEKHPAERLILDLSNVQFISVDYYSYLLIHQRRVRNIAQRKPGVPTLFRIVFSRSVLDAWSIIGQYRDLQASSSDITSDVSAQLPEHQLFQQC